jgi:hypothetical protein
MIAGTLREGRARSVEGTCPSQDERNEDRLPARYATSDLFGGRGRELLETLESAEPWRTHVLAGVAMIDELDREIHGIEKELRALGATTPTCRCS